MPGEAPLEGLAADWIAPRDVISRQPPWITFPGLPCLAACIPPPIKAARSCHVAAHSALPVSFPSSLALPHPPPAPPLTISGVCPSQKLFLHHLSGNPGTLRQNSRWAIWLAVSLCLFPCCQGVRWDKTLFCCICHVLSVGRIRNEKSLGYRTCGWTDWAAAVKGVPLYQF